MGFPVFILLTVFFSYANYVRFVTKSSGLHCGPYFLLVLIIIFKKSNRYQIIGLSK